MPGPDGPGINLAEIARIAKVSRAAVSNWRHRHADFPAPHGGTEANPEFRLVDIEAWLRDHKKLREDTLPARLWPLIENIGDRTLQAAVLATAAQPHIDDDQFHGALADAAKHITPDGRGLADQAHRITCQADTRETLGYLIGRWTEVNASQSKISAHLARLMAGVAAVVRAPASGQPLTVLDPVCGIGDLLLAAAQRFSAANLTLVGAEPDLGSAALAGLRLALAHPGAPSDVRQGHSLRADPLPEVLADVVLSIPPWNERDWGHDELADDARWPLGSPPRAESELAWLQHVMTRLQPHGVAVLLLPPAVASRRSGQRIRSALVRSGALRGVIALPAGIAPPYGVSLTIWVLQAPDPQGAAAGVFMVDASALAPADGARSNPGEWTRIAAEVEATVRAAAGEPLPGQGPVGGRWVVLSALQLLDDQIDLSPTAHVPVADAVSIQQLDDISAEFARSVDGLGRAAAVLRRLRFVADGGPTAATTVGDLESARALTLRAGQAIQANEGTPPIEGAVPVLTVPALVRRGRADAWVDAESFARLRDSADPPVVAVDGDVLVVGVETVQRSAWVHEGPPTILGPQLYVVDHDKRLFDGWFIAGCLGAASNIRGASSRATTSTKIDVRRLQVLQLPLDEQRAYGAAFQAVDRLRHAVEAIAGGGERLIQETTELLAAGRLNIHPA